MCIDNHDFLPMSSETFDFAAHEVDPYTPVIEVQEVVLDINFVGHSWYEIEDSIHALHLGNVKVTALDAIWDNEKNADLGVTLYLEASN